MKIFAILLNPTIDEIFEIENFYVGGTYKVKSSIIYPVGKAISFGLGIRELNTDQNILKIIALIGQEEESIYSNFLKEKQIGHEFVIVKGKTRSNKTINDPIQNTTTHIREIGFKVEENELQELITLLKKNVSKNDICVFSGSIPPNINPNVYFDLIKLAKEQNAICVLDTSGVVLQKGAKAYPKIIKPNLTELSQILEDPKLLEIDFSNISDACNKIIESARKLLNKKMKIILITLGGDGAISLTRDLIFYGKVHIEKPIDTVGSGDAFLAGFVLNYFLKEDLLTCFRYAVACGAANTLIPGPGVFKLEDVKELLKKVEINKLS